MKHNKTLNDAYREFNKARTQQLNEALTLADWNPAKQFPYAAGKEEPELPAFNEYRYALRPLAWKVIQQTAFSQRDVLTKLMVLTHMCPDLTELHKAMAALFGTGNRTRALHYLEVCLSHHPKGAKSVASIRQELEACQQN